MDSYGYCKECNRREDYAVIRRNGGKCRDCSSGQATPRADATVDRIKAAFISFGFAPFVQERRGCIKTPIDEHVIQLLDWNKKLEAVRDVLVGELRKNGYTNDQLQSLIAPIAAKRGDDA